MHTHKYLRNRDHIFIERLQMLAALAAVAVLAACSSQPAYHPAEHAGDTGYSETRIEDDRYMITFTGNSWTEKATVREYALLRAAELTVANGYEWFRTVNTDTTTERDVDVVGPDPLISRPDFVYTTCTDNGCYQSRTVYTGTLSSRGYTTVDTQSYITSLEILMGSGDKPQDTRVYNASQIIGNLKPKAMQAQ